MPNQINTAVIGKPKPIGDDVLKAFLANKPATTPKAEANVLGQSENGRYSFVAKNNQTTGRPYVWFSVREDGMRDQGMKLETLIDILTANEELRVMLGQIADEITAHLQSKPVEITKKAK
jgi:hypothetical protein